MKGAIDGTFRNRYGPMRLRSAVTLTLLLPLAACASLFGGGEDPPGGRNSPDEVRALFRASVAALNRHELNRFMGRFGADIRMYTGREWLNGYADVREHFARLLEHHPDLRIDIDSIDARRTADDVVVVRYRWRIHPPAAGPEQGGTASAVYMLRAGDWEEVLSHLTGDVGAQQPIAP